MGLPSRVYMRHTELSQSVRYTMSLAIWTPWADMDPVGREERPVAPGAEEGALPVEDDDGRIFALEGIDPVVGIGGDGAHHRKRFSSGELRPVLEDGIGVGTGADGGHSEPSCRGAMRYPECPWVPIAASTL